MKQVQWESESGSAFWTRVQTLRLHICTETAETGRKQRLLQWTEGTLIFDKSEMTALMPCLK